MQYLLPFSPNCRQVASIETSAISRRQIAHKLPLVYTHVQFLSRARARQKLHWNVRENCTKNPLFKRALRSAKCGGGRKDEAGWYWGETELPFVSFSVSFSSYNFDIVCYFCGIFITKLGACSRFSGRPSLLCSAVQTASVRVDTPRER